MIDKIIQKYPQLTGHEDIVEFTLELQKVFCVTGFYFTNSEGKTIVGRPTKKENNETHHEMLKRWEKWKKQHDLIASGHFTLTRKGKGPQEQPMKNKKSYTVSHKISSKQSCPQ